LIPNSSSQLTTLHEQHRQLVGQVDGDVPVYLSVTVDFGVVQQIVEVNERQSSAVNVHLDQRKLELSKEHLAPGEPGG